MKYIFALYIALLWLNLYGMHRVLTQMPLEPHTKLFAFMLGCAYTGVLTLLTFDEVKKEYSRCLAHAQKEQK